MTMKYQAKIVWCFIFTFFKAAAMFSIFINEGEAALYLFSPMDFRRIFVYCVC